MKKQEIFLLRTFIWPDTSYVKIDDFLNYLSEQEKLFKENNPEVEIVKFNIINDYDNSLEYSLEGYRMETDEEYKKRINKTKETRLKIKKDIEKEEKKLYEKLKKKYEV